MLATLPKNAIEFMRWPWEQIEPYYRHLEGRRLTAGTVSAWLADWSLLAELLYETYQRLYVNITADTTNAAAEAAFQGFLETVYPFAQTAEQRLKEKLLSSGLQPAGFEMPLRNLRAEAEIFQDANLPLQTAELKLNSEYDRITGAQTVIWEGEEVTLAQIQSVYQSTDRQQRETAWRLAAERQLADRAAINDLWTRFMRLRREMAHNAGLPNFRAYRWKRLLRFDYTPDDCKLFHRAIEEVGVPAACRLYKRRRRKLGVETLRPWDLNVDPDDLPPLRPFSQVSELEQRTAAIFEQVDAQLGAYFHVMRSEALLDLENRKGKAPGGYCTDFPVIRRPFIFMNAVGLHEDVQTLLHEGGHAFHVFESAHLPYLQQLAVGMEFGEVASMGMEMLASPYLTAERGGFYTPRQAARARIEHLEGAICYWPYMAVVDAFQHWVYENESLASDPQNCDARWGELWAQYMPGVDWNGLEQERITGWQRKLHIHTDPFYYIEYGMAQLGAFQVWRNALRDQAGTVAAYRRALALGGTVALPDLYRTAGVKFAFDAETLSQVIALAEQKIEELEKVEGD